MAEEKRPVIARGELYVEPISKKGGGGDKEIPHEYDTAKQRVLNDIDVITQEIQEEYEIFLDEKIVCIRMEPKFEAKSYVPSSLILSKDDMDIVGGRKYSFTDNNGEGQSAKLYFMRTNDTGIQLLRHTLKEGMKDATELWRKHIGSIRSLDLLTSEEKIMGLSDDWTSGVVEIILHPLNIEQEMISEFHRTIGISKECTAIKSYKDGLTFISAKCNRDEIERIKRFNPLRALHPLGRISIVPIRGEKTLEAPTVVTAKRKSKLTIGVFDGGADDTIPLLKGYTKSYDCVGTPAHSTYMAHADAVCGAVLYGDLNERSIQDVLSSPPIVSVDSFRVLPLKDTDDFEAALGLYEAIDAIETVVQNRPDIKLYNISFGPEGAIFDDSISRFTYVMDRLTYDVADGEVNPLFCVAVGNAGELVDPLNRIQAPADMVNGLGIGAYSYSSDGEKVRASYSCLGTGREGAKVKPDFLEFGGNREHPFVLVGAQHNTLSLNAGTSFASPMVAGKIGRLMAQCETIVPHLGRTLLIHYASLDKNISQNEQGYGFCTNNVDDVLSCEDKKVTILYSGKLEPSHTVKLPIFAPDINKVNGTVKITWTIAAIVDPCANDPDAYTNNCIEDVFIPHDLTFTFTKRGSKTFTLNLTKDENIVKAKELLSKGYKRSDLPASKPAKKSWNETDLRMNDLKWDTVIKKGKPMRGPSLLNPYLTLHAIGRNGYETKELKYFTAITIEAKEYAGSLYDAILQNYQNLIPIEIRNANRVMVQID